MQTSLSLLDEANIQAAVVLECTLIDRTEGAEKGDGKETVNIRRVADRQRQGRESQG